MNSFMKASAVGQSGRVHADVYKNAFLFTYRFCHNGPARLHEIKKSFDDVHMRFSEIDEIILNRGLDDI